MNEEALTLLDMLKRSDGLLFLAANAAELAGLLRRSRDELGLEPPDDYMLLLHQSDGAIADGVMIYGSKIRQFDDVLLPEMVDVNLQRREYRDDLGGVLLVGEVDDDFIAFRPKDALYWRVDRASGDLLGSAPDLRSMVASLLRNPEPV